MGGMPTKKKKGKKITEVLLKLTSPLRTVPKPLTTRKPFIGTPFSGQVALKSHLKPMTALATRQF